MITGIQGPVVCPGDADGKHLWWVAFEKWVVDTRPDQHHEWLAQDDHPAKTAGLSNWYQCTECDAWMDAAWVETLTDEQMDGPECNGDWDTF